MKDLESFTRSKKVQKKIKQIFSVNQMALIEAAFERAESSTGMAEQCGYENGDYSDDIRESVKFGSRYKKDSTRLKKIMQNIIQNGGEFNPYEPVKSKTAYSLKKRQYRTQMLKKTLSW
jgi:hypothetical protein